MGKGASGPASPDDVLGDCGLANLGEDPPLESIERGLGKLSDVLRSESDPSRRKLLHSGAVAALKRAKFPDPKGMVHAALSCTDETPITPAETFGSGILDIVVDGSEPLYMTVDGFTPSSWPLAALPWRTIPTRQQVEAALQAGGNPPWEEIRGLLDSRVVLPHPRGPWASLLAAWDLGTYLMDRFNYYPELLLEGPPERGKTRLGKALVFPAFRGVFTPAPTPAVVFRDRGYHRVTLLLDVEDLPASLERSELGDLVLNSFERDGVVRRTTHPDAPPQRQIEAWAVYGATILATNRAIPDHSPLRSRCIRVPMPEAGAVVVPDAVTPDEVVELRAQMLAWAATMMDKELPTVSVPFTGRMRDLATPVLRVLALVSPDDMDAVVHLLDDLDRDRRTEASRSWEARVAVALWQARDDVEASRLFLDALMPYVNEGFPESEHLTLQNIGTARRNLGLRSGRGGAAGRTYITWPGDEAAQQLHDRYSPDGPQKPSEPSASSVALVAERVSPLKTLKTPKEVFSPHMPSAPLGPEHPEGPEPSVGRYSKESLDLFEKEAIVR